MGLAVVFNHQSDITYDKLSQIKSQMNSFHYMLSLNISIYTDALMYICNLETFMHRSAMKFRFKFETVPCYVLCTC